MSRRTTSPASATTVTTTVTTTATSHLSAVTLWGSGLAISLSSAAALVGLARHLPEREIAQISAVFLLSLMVSVVPTAAQGSAAATRLRLGVAGRLRWRPVLVGQALCLAVSPVIAVLAHLPYLAVLCTALQLLPATAAAVVRGDLIGQGSFGVVARNQFAESATRAVVSLLLGWFWGASGMAAGLLAGTLVAACLLRPWRVRSTVVLRLSSVVAGLATFTACVNVDVLLLPSLDPAQAPAYTVAALPGKAVFLAMLAAGWLTISSSSRLHSGREVRRLALRALGAACGLATVATAGSHLFSDLLGHPPAPLADTALLALGMGLAGSTWIVLMVLVARQSPMVCVPGAVVLVFLGSLVAMSPSSAGLVPAMVVSQAAGLLTALALATRTACQRPPLDPVLGLLNPDSPPPIRQVGARL